MHVNTGLTATRQKIPLTISTNTIARIHYCLRLLGIYRRGSPGSCHGRTILSIRNWLPSHQQVENPAHRSGIRFRIAGVMTWGMIFASPMIARMTPVSPTMPSARGFCSLHSLLVLIAAYHKKIALHLCTYIKLPCHLFSPIKCICCPLLITSTSLSCSGLQRTR